MNMRQTTKDEVYEIVLGSIQDIENTMTRQTVRGSADPNLRNPAVDENSSWNEVLLRLRNQTNAACILADLFHLVPAANNDERNVLNQVTHTLREMFHRIILGETD